MKIRAAVLEEFGQPLAVQEVELAEPKAGEVLVRLEALDLYLETKSVLVSTSPKPFNPWAL